MYPHQIRRMDDNLNWSLLCHKLFGDEFQCPLELVEVGRNIACNCKGHPLSVLSIAGFLSTCHTNLDVWEHVLSQQLDQIDEDEISKIQVDPRLKGFVEFFAKDGLQLLGQLMHGQSKLQIIPIVGMGENNGKTILAQLLYTRALRGHHFDTNAWVRIREKEMMGTKQRNVLVTLQDLLDSLHKSGMPQLNDDDIAVRLRKTLKRRRYFIVVDDIRDTLTWDTMMRFFPDEGNGSRIILTAREWSINYVINPSRLDSYWEFLLGKTAGLLTTSGKTLEFWKLVDERVHSSKSNHDSILDLLSISFNNLPHHLKPCFLYMGAFPEDCTIRTSQIIQLWIAEGFIRPTAENSLEDTATMYLQSLIDRNLLLVIGKDFYGKAILLKIDGVFWRFCQKKALENFFWFNDLNGQNIAEDEERLVRRVSVHPMSQLSDDEQEVISLARTYLCTGPASLDLAPTFFVLRLLRVLNVLGIEFDQFPDEMLKLVNLKYMALNCHSDLPPSISVFRNLQTLITSEVLSLPPELWGMTEIRYIYCEESCNWNTSGMGESYNHEKLQTLINIPASEVTRKFLRHNPNLRHLLVIFDASTQSSPPLDCLDHFEILECTHVRSKIRHDFLSYLRIPDSLRKLCLRSCIIQSKVMTTHVGLLPFFEDLELEKCDFVELLWEPAEGGFPTLKYLMMKGLNLVNWRANSTHFKELQGVIIYGCHAIKEIPFDVGEMPALRVIEVDENCSPSPLSSAKREYM